MRIAARRSPDYISTAFSLIFSRIPLEPDDTAPMQSFTTFTTWQTTTMTSIVETSYIYLVIAVISEVIATTSLKAADEFSRFWPSVLVVAGYASAFWFLSLTLRTLPVGIVYAIWAGVGVGVALAAVAGVVIYKQTLDAPRSQAWC